MIFDWMVEADIDGSKTVTFGPKSGVPAGGGGVVPPEPRVNDWAAVPLQVYCCNWTLSAVEALGTSRHLPLLRFTKWYAPEASATGCHCWLAPPPYSQSWVRAPSAVDTFVSAPDQVWDETN